MHKTEGNQADLDRRLESCFIPYKSSDTNFDQKVSIASFDTFLEDRAAMIINRIKEVVGDAWKEPLESDNENIEDDEFDTNEI